MTQTEGASPHRQRPTVGTYRGPQGLVQAICYDGDFAAIKNWVEGDIAFATWLAAAEPHLLHDKGDHVTLRSRAGASVVTAGDWLVYADQGASITRMAPAEFEELFTPVKGCAERPMGWTPATGRRAAIGSRP